MEWKDVGDWLKGNAGTGAALVGSLLTGNLPGAVAAGIALVSSATGTNNAAAAMEQLQSNPETLLKLKELALREEESIREHIRQMTEMQLKDEQAEHKETQETIRSGDNAEDKFVKRTRPGQSWVSLLAAIFYVFKMEDPSVEILLLLLTLPLTYAGLRQIGKGIDVMGAMKSLKPK